MDEKEVSNSHLSVSEETEEKIDSLSPMYFGVSCAFFALRVLSKSDIKDERWSEVREKMLKGSAQLLGLLILIAQRKVDWRKPDLLHKLKTAEKEIEELKRIRHEDAKANEKVVCIFAAQEQRWLIERKKLRQHIGALLNDARALEKKNGIISELNEKLKEMEVSMESKDKKLAEEIQRGIDLEERLSKAENVVEELRETIKREVQEHSSELWKHKTAFIELVSNQRQLEAEMARALRQVEATKEELDSVLEQKEESVMLVQKLSAEIVKMRKDLEQKDKILSAVLRKSKLDTAQKQMLVKEVKLSKAKRKQAELEAERWKTISESRHERQSLRSMLSNQVNSGFDIPTTTAELRSNAVPSSNNGKAVSKSTDIYIDCSHPEFTESNNFPPLSECVSPERKDDLGRMADVKQMEELVCSEVEKYVVMLQQRHDLEIDAFAEQMGLKDEKLEVFHWQLLSMELETKRLQSHLAGQNQEVLQLRHENMKLKALSMGMEEELASIKGQLASQLDSQGHQGTKWDPPSDNNGTWTDVKIIKIKPEEEEQRTSTGSIGMMRGNVIEREEATSLNLVEDKTLLIQSPGTEFEDEKEIACHSPIQEAKMSHQEVNDDNAERLASLGQQFDRNHNTQWRMDIHALGISYKIKRLKQQFVLLERLIGKQETVRSTDSVDNELVGIRDFLSFMSLLNKQVSRYNSLQEKTDELCQRMHDDEANVKSRDSNIARTKGKTKALENFLEQTFQLQRYVVLTGQKLMEIQSKISLEFGRVADQLENSGSFDIKRFANSVKTLIQEVQRGLEVRITRIIGDLEGTLACEGMIHLSR